MLYEPRMVVNLRTNILNAVIQTTVLFFEDYFAQENKAWYFYAGVFLGELVVATGIVEASATIYVVATLAKIKVERSPNGAQIGVFLDGVRQSTFDAFSNSVAWDFINVIIPDDHLEHRIDLVNEVNVNGDKTSPIEWLSISTIEIVNGYAVRVGTNMADIVSFRLKDSEQDTATGSLAVYFPPDLYTYAQYQTWVNAFAPELDAMTGSQITEITVQMSIPVPAGLKGSPTALYLNERGGLITFDTSGDRAESVRIPAILSSIMGGNEFNVAVNPTLAVVTRLTTATTAASMRPQSPFGYNFESATRGIKSFRKR